MGGYTGFKILSFKTSNNSKRDKISILMHITRHEIHIDRKILVQVKSKISGKIEDRLRKRWYVFRHF